MIRRKTALAFVSAALFAAALQPAGANAAPAPAWKLTATSQPTNFAPGAKGNPERGPLYTFIATNVGGAPTSGPDPILFEATLPAGLTIKSVAGASSDQASAATTCGAVGQEIDCESAGPVRPGHWLRIGVVLDVAVGASGALQATASIEGGGAVPAFATTTTQIDAAPAPFGFLAGESGFGAPLTGEDGAAATQAGSHPYQLTVEQGFPTQFASGTGLSNSGHPRDVVIDLPRGAIANPNATPVLCTEVQLAEFDCPLASQVGTVTVVSRIAGEPIPLISELFNMVPPYGAPASFGFDAAGVGILIHIVGSVRSDGDYGLSGTANDLLALPGNPVISVQAQLWGDPSGEGHDGVRGTCKSSPTACPVEQQDTAFLTMPGECSGSPLTTKGRVRSWEEPDSWKEASYEGADLGGNPVSVSGCNQLEFKPTIEAKPTTNLAASPTGLDVDLHVPQNFDLDGLASANFKDVTLNLPEGLSVNASSADGLGACSQAQANVNTMDASECPDASKLGSVAVGTPLLDDPLPGALYLAEPYDNPFGSLIALYLSVDDPQTGTVANLAGEVSANPITGQLSTTFEGNPELPIEDVGVHLFKGPRASLRTPVACGTFTSTTTIVPWSSPETAEAHPSDSFAITTGPDGGACPTSEATAPHSPTFSAGTLEPVAGAYSPFLLRTTRNDASQPLAGIEATLPPGLTGKLAGVAICSEAQIAQAKAREKPEMGALEKASPSCPASSEVGTIDVAAGAGISPLHVEGRAYLAGPYKGAPLSLAIITPAVAGPFDLGTVVVRTALHIDPRTTQINAVSDPLPQRLEGIPLDVRSVSLRMARPQFTLNPTSCNPMQIDASFTSSFGQLANLSSPFQVGACSSLPFKPRLSLRLQGKTERGENPKLIATLKAKPGEAGIAKASVTLPRSAFLDQAHIRTICTRVQFAADQCPKGSIYGRATATTPLLDYPLSGPAYLRSSDNTLPDLVMALKGPDRQPIEVELVGRTDSLKGALRNSFDLVPDAPVTSFRLELFGGKRGLVVNSRDTCARTYRATVKMTGQNGKPHEVRPAVRSSCGKTRRRDKRRR